VVAAAVAAGNISVNTQKKPAVLRAFF